MESKRAKYCAEPKPEDIDFIIYHKWCPDGWVAFMIAYMFLLKLGKKDEDIWRYGATHKDKKENIPDVTGRNVLMVDFSYSKSVIRHMRKTAKSFVLLDHHEKAILLLSGEDNCYFETKQCGASMAFRYFYGHNTPIPEQILHTRARDLWIWDIPDSREVSMAVYTYLKLDDNDNNIKLWSDYLTNNNTLAEFKLKGKPIWDNAKITIEFASRYFVEFNFFGYPTAFVEARNLQSEIGEAILAKREKIQVAVIWSYDAFNKIYEYKTRSRAADVNAPNVNELCMRFGGGGHKNAAGIKLRAFSTPDQLFTLAKEMAENNTECPNEYIVDMGKDEEPVAEVEESDDDDDNENK